MESAKPAVLVLSRILAQVQRGEIQIPALPTVVAELRGLVSKSDSKLEAVVALLERDPALVARVLQLGRNAAFGRPGQVVDIPFIIQRVGFRQINDIVETVWANDCFRIADARYQPYAAMVSRHSLARAVAMRSLAEAQRLEPFSAYMAGLFADVGASFLLWAIVDKSRGRAPEPEDAMAFIREHHESMSGAVLKRWGHSEAVIALVRRHHAPALTPPASPYASLLVVASQVAAELTREEDLTAPAPWPGPVLLERCVSHAGLSEETLRAITFRLRDEYATILSAVT